MFVVPANDETHTLRRELFCAMAAGFPFTTTPCGYGSRHSPIGAKISGSWFGIFVFVLAARGDGVEESGRLGGGRRWWAAG